MGRGLQTYFLYAQMSTLYYGEGAPDIFSVCSDVNIVLWGGELQTYFLYAQMSTLYYGEGGSRHIFCMLRCQHCIMGRGAPDIFSVCSDVNIVLWGGGLQTYFLYAQRSTLYYGEGGSRHIFCMLRCQHCIMGRGAPDIYSVYSDVNIVLWGGGLQTYFLYAQMSTLYYGEGGSRHIFCMLRCRFNVLNLHLQQYICNWSLQIFKSTFYSY